MIKQTIITTILLLAIMFGAVGEDIGSVENINIDLSSRFTLEEKTKLTEMNLDQDTYIANNNSVKPSSRIVPITYEVSCESETIDKNGSTILIERDCTTEDINEKRDEELEKYYKKKLRVKNLKENKDNIIQEGEINI